MKKWAHRERSSGEEVTAARQALRARALESLAPLGTCWRVGMLAWRMDGREGRGGLVAGWDGEVGGGEGGRVTEG